MSTHPLDLHPLYPAVKEAWNESKKEQQPVYDELPITVKSQLLDTATQIKSGGFAFECAVASKMAKVEPEATAEIEEVAAHEETLAPEPTPEPTPEPEPEPEATTVEEKEHLDLKGPLPADFPSHTKLHEAGINTYGQLNKVEDLTTIEGIGPAFAKSIKKRLKSDAKSLNK